MNLQGSSLVVVGERQESLERRTREWGVFKVNVNKTKFMVQRARTVGTTLQYKRGSIIKQVEKLKYFGFTQ